MYFEIENTPEHIKRARRTQVVQDESPKEECPRLILAPFSRPPQVVFENVVIGSCCERQLEVFNPSKNVQQVTLGRALPPGLVIHLPGEWLVLEPETCYCLTMMWTPLQPTALRETIRFTNENRGRYDIIVVLKSVMNVKGKAAHPKGFKISPGKIKKKVNKKSPVAIYKKKAEIIYNTTKVKKTVNVVHSTEHRILRSSHKENISTYDENSIRSHIDKCPFDSSTSIDFNFNTSEVFSNMRRPISESNLQKTYEKSYTVTKDDKLTEPRNVLKPINKQAYNTSASDIFDNLTFTPLKTIPAKNEKLNKGPQIILSMNSESDFDDSLDMKSGNKENETHSIICITSSQPSSKWLTVNHNAHFDNQFVETPTVPNKKIPNTSSPKEFNSPNFSINTEFSRISDLSFFPQRFSTERKVLPKIINETHDILDDIKLSSDTYTKDSPNTPLERHGNQMYMENRPPPFFMREQNPKMCRQALFMEYQHNKEYADKHYLPRPEHNVWQTDHRTDIRSPPRSLTPPLQSIPEESIQFSETQTLDKTDTQMATFTINRTFDKKTSKQKWSKRAVRAEPELWKVPQNVPRKSLKPKLSLKSKDQSNINQTFDSNKSINQNVSLNQIGNVYSQSFTVDPFLSSTYFYDVEAVNKFEIEFKRWLNCILTPPADLHSNVEQKIDVGKAWIENRNKEVPAAPTREHVSSTYHNSHRLVSLRKAARALFLSPENAQVFLKLNVQIEKKLICIRTDRNLHLDVGLQKAIMELLLCYNPLWLRIGLEAIYGLVLPLKSNSDIDGLTTFIIQRLFKNPYIKNKQSKSSAPNMLLPAYMEAIKKFTLKKFLMLVFFLDQAKQKKLISHDPCLFCRNAICKESREIIIRFTREVIAGIGDITKHLRPLGYVVTHKQSYLDEYKYAVHNIAVDIRDGVRLTKVMEIILIKNGLLNQLRTPPISRLQKIHNVQVALNALKEANFVIVGDITANDIADGHREKTLSLLWQLIHVFRAPLFEKAANVIQTWWRKKFEVIMEKRREEEKVREKLNRAASTIQYWWREINYNRMMKYRMHLVTSATITIQKYFRMWLCKTRLQKLRISVRKIEDWFIGIKLKREARVQLHKLKTEKRHKSAVILQAYIRRWLCMKHYKVQLKKIVLVQSAVRCFLIRKWYLRFKKSAILIQRKYRGKLIMKRDIQNWIKIKQSIVRIQSYFKMIKYRTEFLRLKNAVKIAEVRYIALRKMRDQRNYYCQLKSSAIRMQALCRSKMTRSDYTKKKQLIINIQRKFRAQQAMKIERDKYQRMRTATITLQKYIKAYLLMKRIRENYTTLLKSTILIQKYFRSYIQTKSQSDYFKNIQRATIVLQIRYRSLLQMRARRHEFLQLKISVSAIQQRFRANRLMKKHKVEYQSLRKATLMIQRRFRGQMKMMHARSNFKKLKKSCIFIQTAYRAYKLGRQQRQKYLIQKKAAIKIQNWFKSCKKSREVNKQYVQTKQACMIIQKMFRAYYTGRIQRQEYLRLKTATVCIQKYFRSYIMTKRIRQEYIKIKTSTITIQKFYKSYLETKKQRETYLRMKTSTVLIQTYYRRYKETLIIKQEYQKLKMSVVLLQRKYRSIHDMRRDRSLYIKVRTSAIVIQQRYRALLSMRSDKQSFLKMRSAVINVQRRYRALLLMRQVRAMYLLRLNSTITIQRFYRAFKKGKEQRKMYLGLKCAAIVLQRRYKAISVMRKERQAYFILRTATLTIQTRFRARLLMLQESSKFKKSVNAAVIIQRKYRAHKAMQVYREEFTQIRTATIVIQKYYRSVIETRKIKNQFIELKRVTVLIQRRFKAILEKRKLRRIHAANKIRSWYLATKRGIECRRQYLTLRKNIIIMQSFIRMYILRKRFLKFKSAAITIQKYYRFYKLGRIEREKYNRIKIAIIKLQAHIRCFIERTRYLKVRAAIIESKQREAAICIQKNVRRCLIQSWYQRYRKHTIFIQQLWRGKLVTRLMRCEFLQKKRLIVKLQSVIRGYLVRKEVEAKKENLLKIREEKRQNWAASKIQALFRGHSVRVTSEKRVLELRRRWRDGGLKSTQETIKERNEEAMDVLRNMSDIETVIRAFRSLELLTEVFPMMYNTNASSIVRRVYIYMSVTNRSISSIEVLKSAASVLVNLTRYKITGPKIYERDRIPPVLKFMWRFSNSETQLFCILSTYLWLFSKYEDVKKDLTEFLHVPENHKILVTIKGNIGRMKRMASNVTRNKFNTPQPSKFVSHTMNQSLRDNMHNTTYSGSSPILLPALEPDYGIIRADKPRYFEDAQQAISCLFQTYKL